MIPWGNFVCRDAAFKCTYEMLKGSVSLKELDEGKPGRILLKKSQLPDAKKLRERANEMKLRAYGLIREADAMIAKAEEIENKIRVKT